MTWRYRYIVLLFCLPLTCNASSRMAASESAHLLLGLALVLAGSGLSWSILKIGIPGVVGELFLGMGLAFYAHSNPGFWSEVIVSPTFSFLAQLGSILLLFEIGLESDLKGLRKLGKHATFTALIGIILPFILGAYFIGGFILHSQDPKLNFFIGATLAATSTGISMRVFKDFAMLGSSAAQIVLSASVIDDVLGLIILAVASSLITVNSISMLAITGILLNVGLFFVLGLLIARKLNPYLIQIFLKIRNDEVMITVFLIASCLFWSWCAEALQLSAIVGAFISGLILDPLMFASTGTIAQDIETNTDIIDNYSHSLFSQILKPLTSVFVPIFFVYAGTQVDLSVALNWHVLYLGTLISIAAIIGKVFCGIFLPKEVNRWLVGFGMVPRGEVGLIFALAGQQLGVFNPEIFASILFMVVVTSVVTPIALQKIITHR